MSRRVLTEDSATSSEMKRLIILKGEEKENKLDEI
jgi:hypothetical protein